MRTVRCSGRLGGVCPRGCTPRGQTDACEKVTFPQTTVVDGKYWYDDSRLEVAWDNNIFLSWYPALVMKNSVIDFHYVLFKILLLQVRIYGK